MVSSVCPSNVYIKSVKYEKMYYSCTFFINVSTNVGSK